MATLGCQFKLSDVGECSQPYKQSAKLARCIVSSCPPVSQKQSLGIGRTLQAHVSRGTHTLILEANKTRHENMATLDQRFPFSAIGERSQPYGQVPSWLDA